MIGIESKSRFGPLPYVFGALLGVSLGLFIISGVLFFKTSRGSVTNGNGDGSGPTYQRADYGQIDLSRRNAIVAATEQVAPAVVAIQAQYLQVFRRTPFPDDFFDRLFPNYRNRVTRRQVSLGSGVIIDGEGYVLTNEHVIRNAEQIVVTLSTGNEVEGHLIDSAPDYDLALLKIDGGPFPYASLGDSDDLYVGEWAIAIGSPFGQLLNDTQPTVTVGVISAKHRDVKSSSGTEQIFKDMIQTDAAINPGNSGGPLVNSNGRVVGINTFIFSSGDGGNLGMGFAIPINQGKWIVDEIRNYGRVRDVWIGLTVRQVTPELATGLSLPADRGLLIREIELDSPADKAGLKPGDLIVAVNGVQVVSVYGANRTIFGSKIGDKLEFEIKRGGKTKRLSVELEEKPNQI